MVENIDCPVTMYVKPISPINKNLFDDYLNIILCVIKLMRFLRISTHDTQHSINLIKKLYSKHIQTSKILNIQKSIKKIDL